MNHKVGRNDPCPCGSGKKYKSCCLLKAKTPILGRKKFTAKVLSTKPVQQEQEQEMFSADYGKLMERTFGEAIHTPDDEKPPVPENPDQYVDKNPNTPERHTEQPF